MHVAGAVHRPRWVAVWPMEVTAALRTSSAVHGGWDELLEILRSSGSGQKSFWALEGGFGFSGCNSVELGLLWRSVALRAKGTPLVASWRFQECGGEV